MKGSLIAIVSMVKDKRNQKADEFGFVTRN